MSASELHPHLHTDYQTALFLLDYLLIN